MDTKVTAPAPATLRPAIPAQQSTTPASTRAAAPEKVEIPQAAPSVDTAYKPALEQAALSSGLTTYKDEDSGRLIVRVYDRESGDVLVEFPPERAFRPAVVPGKTAAKPKKSFSV